MNEEVLSEKVGKLPKTTGVYLLKDENGGVIYIGKARNIKDRVCWYFQTSNGLSSKTRQMVQKVKDVDYIETISELEALLVEASLIKRYRPKYNVIWRDDKRPLYIKINTNKEFPTVGTSRREDSKECQYFGPFPSSRTAREILRTLRRIFPYCSQRKYQRRCFYSHLKLCDPCPAEIIKMPADKARRAKKRYRKSIQYLVKVLSGNSKKVLSQLHHEMNFCSNRGQFEQAARLRDQIQRLQSLNQQHFTALDYLKNPNLAADVYKEEICEFKRWLETIARKYSLAFTQPKQLKRIECIDISNIFGFAATGSLVVFIGGQARPSLYRRFKIRSKEGINDPAMISEVVKRRLDHPEWSYPQLLVVDGGSSQVASAMRACQEKRIDISIIGLAKRNEEIIFPLASGKFAKERPSNNSGGLSLIRRIRDEAHRFANQYHQYLRKKAILARK